MSELIDLMIKAAAELPWVLRWIVQVCMTVLMVAATCKLVVKWFPNLPHLLGAGVKAGATLLSRGGSGTVALAKRATIPTHPVKRRWEKPFWVGYEFLTGLVFAVFMLIYCFVFLVVATYGIGELPLWQCLIAFAISFLLAFFMKVFAVRAENAWFQIRTGQWRD